MSLQVLLLPPDPPEDLVVAAAPAGCDVEVTRLREHTTAALHQALPHADVVIGDWSGRLRLGEAEAALAPSVRLVQQPTTGVEAIDLGAWAQRGVPVANSGSANAGAVAEWCLGATMNLLRSYRWSDSQVRHGHWPQVSILDEAEPRELAGAHVGIVGAGEIGRRLARLYALLGCEVAYWSPRSQIEGAHRTNLPDLFASSDIVIVAIARAPETLGLVSEELLSVMPTAGILIDVSRGGIVDQAAVVSRLSLRHLSGAALDVYSAEPPVLDSAWTDCEHILLSPHVAGVTREAMARTYRAVAENVTAIASGRAPAYVVNGPARAGTVSVAP